MRKNNSTNGPAWEEYLKRARRALYDGEPDIALTHAEQVLQADPENPDAKRIREEALALEAKSRSRFKSLFGKLGARAAKAAGLGKQAIDELRLQHRADPSNWRAAIALAEACIQSGYTAEGRAALLAALGGNQTNERFLDRAAEIFRLAGDAEHEVACLRYLKEYQQNNPALDRRLRNAEANLLYQKESQHKPVESRAELERVRLEQAKARDLQARIEQAVTVYRDHPEDMRNRVWLARLLIDTGAPSNLGDALQILQKILEEDPEHTDAARVLADLHRREGRLAEALELYEKIAASKEDDLDLQNQLLDLREEYFEKRAGEDPEDTEAAEALKDIRRVRMEKEIGELEQRAKLNPNDPDLLIELGDKYTEHDRLDDAIARYQSAARSPLRRFRASMRLGDAFLAKQKPELALLQFEKALEAAPLASHGLSEQRKRALYALGCLHQDLGDIDAALERFQEIYAEDIGFEDVSERFETVYSAKRKKEQTSETS